MLNFVLGTVAGSLIAGVVLITAVRQPDVQGRLGLFPVSNAPMMPAAKLREDVPCRPVADPAVVGQPDMLFSKRRFWSVKP